MNKTIGILGGMGPKATYELMKDIISMTKAQKDQDYPRILIDCNTGIPDRTNAILNNGESPVDTMKESTDKLKEMGADFVIIPCNTAHFFIEELMDLCNIPFINMIEETVSEIKFCGIKKVALLATEGTIKTKIYEKELEANYIECVTPDDDEQAEIMRVIYEEIKADKLNYSDKSLIDIVTRLKNEGAEAVVLGCTELPLVLNAENSPLSIIVPNKILAKKAVEFAGYQVITK